MLKVYLLVSILTFCINLNLKQNGPPYNTPIDEDIFDEAFRISELGGRRHQPEPIENETISATPMYRPPKVKETDGKMNKKTELYAVEMEAGPVNKRQYGQKYLAEEAINISNADNDKKLRNQAIEQIVEEAPSNGKMGKNQNNAEDNEVGKFYLI